MIELPKFGKLLVLGKHSGFRGSWLCRCDCGQKLWLRGTDLVTFKQRHCGKCSPPPEMRERRRYTSPSLQDEDDIRTKLQQGYTYADIAVDYNIPLHLVNAIRRHDDAEVERFRARLRK